MTVHASDLQAGDVIATTGARVDLVVVGSYDPDWLYGVNENEIVVIYDTEPDEPRYLPSTMPVHIWRHVDKAARVTREQIVARSQRDRRARQRRFEAA